MNQKGYINELLKKFEMTNCNPVATPMEPSIKLKKPDREPSEEDIKLPYGELIGTLICMAVATRPGIFLGQFNHCSDNSHWTAAKKC